MTPVSPWARCCSILFFLLLGTVHTLAFIPRLKNAVLRRNCHTSASSGTGAYDIQTISPSDLKIVRFLGEQKLTIEEEDFRSGMRRTRYSARQEASSREMKTVGTAVRMFEAFNRALGRPVVLKEVLPVMKDLANREMEMYRYLYQWGSQSDVRVEDLPVVPLLGSLVTGPEVEEDEEFVYVWRSQFPELEPPRSGNTWLLFDAPRLLPLPSLFRALPNGDLPTSSPSPQAEGAGLFGMLFGGNQPAKADKSLRVCRDVLRGAVQSLAMLHQAGVVHGSLGPSSIIVMLGDSDAGGLGGGFGGASSSRIRGIKFADMGFASSALKQADFTSLVRRDLKQLAVSYLGFLPGYLNPSPSASVEGYPVSSLDGLSLRRSLDELRKGAPLRDALCSLDGWAQATAFLDDAEGWALIEEMLEGRPGIEDPYTVCSGLLERPFLA